jgi:hypothetical protein
MPAFITAPPGFVAQIGTVPGNYRDVVGFDETGNPVIVKRTDLGDSGTPTAQAVFHAPEKSPGPPQH